MKVLRFLLKYFLFRSTRRMKNIERVIRSMGFTIWEYDPEETELLPMIGAAGLEDMAWHYPAFLYINRRIRNVFILEGCSEEERILLLFHEAAHIWYGHISEGSAFNYSNILAEAQADLFLSRLRLLKAAVISLLVASALIALRFIFGGMVA